MERVFKYGKYEFKSFQEFMSVQSLAAKNGYKTNEAFEEYLRDHYTK